MPTAVLLDLYNTLVSSGTDVRRDEINAAMGADLGVDPPERFAALFRQSSSIALSSVVAGLSASRAACSGILL